MGRCIGRKDETRKLCRTLLGKFFGMGGHRTFWRESLGVNIEVGLHGMLSQCGIY